MGIIGFAAPRQGVPFPAIRRNRICDLQQRRADRRGNSDMGKPSVLQDTYPTPPGPNVDGCVTSGRLSRLTISLNRLKAERVLVTIGAISS
jgi:hypothetical protein